MDKAVIAVLQTSEGAHEVARLLEANRIRCLVVDPPQSAGLFHAVIHQYTVLIAESDHTRASAALQGIFASAWFLRAPAPDGRPYHSFEAATVDVLRHHVASHPDVDDFAIRDVTHLADLLVENGWHTVHQAFHHHRLHPHRLGLLEGRSLDEWAHACGCAHAHTRQATE